MTSVAAIRLEDAGQGRYPKICAKSGARAETTVRTDFFNEAGPLVLLVLWSVVAFLFARAVTRIRVTTDLPATREVAWRWRRYGKGLGIMSLAGTLALVGSLWAGQGIVAWAGVALLAGAFLGHWVGQRSLWVTGVIRDGWVFLYGVHPAFARELGARYAHLPEAERPL